MRKSPEERFDEKWIREDCGFGSDCWKWQAAVSVTPNGEKYGHFSLGNGKQESAHRAAWVLKVGEIPPNGRLKNVCGVSLCVNPRHWSLIAPRLPANYVANLLPGASREGLLHVEIVELCHKVRSIAEQLDAGVRPFVPRDVEGYNILTAALGWVSSTAVRIQRSISEEE